MAEAKREEVFTEKVTLTMTIDEAEVLQALVDLPDWGRLGDHRAAVEGLYESLSPIVGDLTAAGFFGKSRKEIIK